MPLDTSQGRSNRQVELAAPQVIVTLGGLPLKTYLKLTGRTGADGRLENFIGKCEQWNGLAERADAAQRSQSC